MSVSVIRGANDKPAASSELISAIADCRDVSGHLFIGYPIVAAPEGRHRIDALLVSPERGLVVFDLVEGEALDGYEARQDDSANRLEGRLRMRRELTRGRELAIPIHALSFAPRVRVDEKEVDPGYPIADHAKLPQAMLNFEWKKRDRHTYETALSAIESVSAIRRSRRRRSADRPDSRGARLKKLEDSIATLDVTQGRAVIETVDGVQRIRGLAGSGKTIVLALKAAYLHAQHPEWRIAVTFNTRSLKGHFRRLINNFSIEQTGEEPDWSTLRIVNAWGAPGPEDRDGLYFEFCRTHGLDYFDFGSARRRFRGREFFAICAQALDQWRQSDDGQSLYDAILVDEAQDLPDSFLQICYESLREPRRLVYAYDELQNLEGEPVSSPEEMFGVREDGKPRVRFDGGDGDGDTRDLILEKCYRNSRPVLTAAHALGFGVYREPEKPGDTGLVQMFDSPHLWRDIGYRLKDGELREEARVTLDRTPDTSPKFLEDHSPLDDLVRFVCFESKEEQIEWVANAVAENLKQDEMRHDDVVVINPNPLTTREEVGPIRSRLLDLGIDSHVAGVDTTADVFFQEHADSVTFTGVHRAKGNEAGMVYVVNAQDCHGRGRNLARLRNQLFVAITRSKAWVRVLGVGAGMRALEAEYRKLADRGFELQFTYPSQEQRERLRIVHRDMTDAERRRVRKSQKELDALAADLESGNLHVEDLSDELARLLAGLDDEQLARLRARPRDSAGGRQGLRCRP